MLQVIGMGLTKFMLLPKWLRHGIDIALVGIAAFFLLSHLYHNAISAAEKRGSDAAYASITKQANEIKAKADAISKAARELNDAQARNISSSYDTIRLSGPGKASCPSSSTRSSDRYSSTSGQSSLSLDPVSNSERIDIIGLPFAPAVSGAEICDLNRNEVLSWRSWYDQLVKAWPKLTNHSTSK